MSYTAKTMWLTGGSVVSVGGVATLLDAFGVEFGYVALTTGVVLLIALVASYFYARKINEMSQELFQLQTIVAEIPTPLMVINREHIIQFINKAGASVGGTTPEALVGKKCYNLFNTEDCPPNCSTGNCACTRAMNQGGVVTSQTIARPGQDQEISIMYSGVALKNRKGEVTGAAEYVVDISSIAKKVAGSQEAAQAASKSISKHVENFSSMSSNMEKISTVMSDNAANVATMAEEMSVNMADVSAALEQAQNNVTNIAGSTEEMTATVAEIAKSAEHARSITCSAVESVSTAEGRVDHLGEASNEIASVVDTIIDIAEQTKLLSLNATIEAARAGEAGKGFAVVASEVKELAKQTNEASIDIQDKIKRISASANDSITDIKDIGKVMEEIDNVVTMIASAVEEQSITTREISGNIKQAADSMGDISGRVSQSSDASREIADNITHVTGEITQIKETSGTLISGCRDLSEASDTLVNASSGA